MLAYLCSASDRDFDAKAMGSPSCKSAAQSPYLLASACTVRGRFLL